MLPLVEEILKSGRVTSPDGRRNIQLRSNITQDIGEFLKNLVLKVGADVTLEVGLAHGVSALFICEGLREAGGHRHIAIDPNQTEMYSGIGVENVRRVGLGDLIELREKPSCVALPELLASGLKIDFAFIDGWHTFDYVLLDFFYIDKMLRVGGVVVLDDCYLSAINSVCRYIATNRNYTVIGISEQSVPAASKATTIARWIAKRSSHARRLFKSKFAEPDETLGFSPFARCVAFEKRGEDNRSWDAGKEF